MNIQNMNWCEVCFADGESYCGKTEYCNGIWMCPDHAPSLSHEVPYLNLLNPEDSPFTESEHEDFEKFLLSLDDLSESHSGVWCEKDIEEMPELEEIPNLVKPVSGVRDIFKLVELKKNEKYMSNESGIWRLVAWGDIEDDCVASIFDGKTYEFVGLPTEENIRRTEAFNILQSTQKTISYVYRTTMCKYGDRCLRRDVCNFAHIPSELRVRKCMFGDSCRKPDCEFSHTNSTILEELKKKNNDLKLQIEKQNSIIEKILNSNRQM